jgi:signal peptide peptidase SppA
MAVEHLGETQCAGLTGVAMRVFNQPLAIGRDKLDIIVRNVVLPRLGGDLEAALVVDQDKSDRKPYSVTSEGIALIDVSGTLVRKSFGLRPWSGMTSYDWLSRELATALADPDVRGLLLCCDSPGGEVAGLYDVVDEFYAARGQKPIFASVCEQATSAAYAIASAADKIYITRTGAVGSVGIVMCHADQSDYDKKQGFKYEYMYFGEHKIDGNPHQPLSDSARASAMAEGRRCYGMLTQAVARNRGMTLKAIKETEAGVFFAEQAVNAGLADEMGTTDVAYAALVDEIARKGDSSMEVAAMPAIRPHKTATTDDAWDGPANKKRLLKGESQAYYESAYAYRDEDGDPDVKSSYDFIHHVVAPSGEVGAASIEGCQSGIAILNGARKGTKLDGSDRKGVYRHLAKHLRDAKLEPADLKGEAQLAAELAIAQVSEAGASAPSSTKGETMARPNVAGATTSPAAGKTHEDDGQKGTKRGKSAPAADDDDDDNDADDNDDEIDANADGADDDDGVAGAGGKSKGKGKGEQHGGKKAGHAEASAPAPAAAAPAQAGMAMAAEIADLCILAGMPGLTAQFIKAGTTPQQAREKLMAARAGADQPEIDQAINANTGTQIHVPVAETGVVKKCKAMAARMNAQRGRA